MFSKIGLFNFEFLAANILKIVPRPEFCPARTHTKKGVCYILKYLWSFVCSAILEQLNYRYCGAIYCTGTAQRHEVDDHRGN